MAYLASVIKTIRLVTVVAVLPFHNPIQLAEQAATVDLLSDGRLDLGIGRGLAKRLEGHRNIRWICFLKTTGHTAAAFPGT
ncbi:MAG: hypothetical protein BZY75_04320 [SAR202 cluster bacterium Io17-Chloro-G7]|nr:MAG: hypothetical protein BZY75_04320 [SAR202 cluster bacterium Io17-Chloro-G7]